MISQCYAIAWMKLTHRKHDPGLTGVIRLSAVPEAKIAYDDTTFSNYRLTGRANGPPCFEEVCSYSSTGSLAMRTFLICDGGIGMSTKPYL